MLKKLKKNTMGAQFIFLLLCIRQCFTFDLPKECKTDLKLNNDHYNVTETYHLGDAYPADAHYDFFGNLFFVESGRNEQGFYFNTKVIKFKTTVPEEIPGLPENVSYSVAIDKSDKKVYFGTGKGIFKYNYETHEATAVSSNLLKLDMIFIDHEGNKYITENNNGIEELYLLDRDKKIRFNSLEALNELAIDDKNNFYYIKEEKLYVLKPTLSKPICVGNVSYDGVAQIAVHNDNVFIASQSLFYFHENDTDDLKLIQNAPKNITAIAFDARGDFALGVRGKLLRYEKNLCPIRRLLKVTT